MKLISLSTFDLQQRYGDREALRIAKEIGYEGYYNMEIELSRYGEEIMIDTARFAVTVLKNALQQRN